MSRAVTLFSMLVAPLVGAGVAVTAAVAAAGIPNSYLLGPPVAALLAAVHARGRGAARPAQLSAGVLAGLVTLALVTLMLIALLIVLSSLWDDMAAFD